MIKAIIYTSNAGHTKRYAEMSAEKLGIPAYSLKEAKKQVRKKSDVIYMTWIKKGKLVDLNKARSKYNLKAICGVGMSGPGKGTTAALQAKNKINALKEKVFYMQGGFDMTKLTGANQIMMNLLKKSLNTVADSRGLPPEQKEMLNMLNNPTDNVKTNNIKELYSWYNREMK